MIILTKSVKGVFSQGHHAETGILLPGTFLKGKVTKFGKRWLVLSGEYKGWCFTTEALIESRGFSRVPKQQEAAKLLEEIVNGSTKRE